jgi:hypothetical protein
MGGQTRSRIDRREPAQLLRIEDRTYANDLTVDAEIYARGSLAPFDGQLR